MACHSNQGRWNYSLLPLSLFVANCIALQKRMPDKVCLIGRSSLVSKEHIFLNGRNGMSCENISVWAIRNIFRTKTKRSKRSHQLQIQSSSVLFLYFIGKNLNKYALWVKQMFCNVSQSRLPCTSGDKDSYDFMIDMDGSRIVSTTRTVWLHMQPPSLIFLFSFQIQCLPWKIRMGII